jgi:hypothetical protein
VQDTEAGRPVCGAADGCEEPATVRFDPGGVRCDRHATELRWEIMKFTSGFPVRWAAGGPAERGAPNAPDV